MHEQPIVHSRIHDRSMHMVVRELELEYMRSWYHFTPRSQPDHSITVFALEDWHGVPQETVTKHYQTGDHTCELLLARACAVLALQTGTEFLAPDSLLHERE